MKKILPLIFILIQFGLYAQKKSGLSLVIEYSIDNLSQSNDNPGNYIQTEDGFFGYVISEFDEGNFSLGLKSSWSLNSKFNLSSGISYSNKDFIGYFICSSCSSFSVSPAFENLSVASREIKQRFLTIPVSVDYFISTGKIRPVVQAGFKNNIEIENDLKELSTGYFLEGFVGASVFFQLTKKWDAGLGYAFQTSISDLYKHSAESIHIRTSSFNFQLNYRMGDTTF